MEKKMTEKLSEEDGSFLLNLARQTISSRFGEEKAPLDALKRNASTQVLEENRGTFVSLHKKGDLRGCIGNIEPVKTIFDGIMDNAKYAAFNDSRFAPLSCEELPEIIIEVSILTRPEDIVYADYRDLISKLRPGIDGVIIRKRYHTATFLPQVWMQLEDPEAFLSQLCMKAGLSSGEWKTGTLDVSKYQVQLFEEAPSYFP